MDAMNERTTTFPSTATEADLTDVFSTDGIMLYSGYWVVYSPFCDSGHAGAAVYGNGGHGKLSKLLEVNGAIGTGEAIRAAMNVIDNVKEF